MQSRRSRDARRWWAALWWLGLALAPPGALAAERRMLVLNNANEPPYTTESGDGFIDVVAQEAFRRAGVGLRLVKLPAERALISANEGIEDGDLVRIAGLEQQYPNLIRVPEKLMDWTFAAFSKNAALPGRWDAIRPRAVGHIKGWKIYEQHMAGAPQVTTADDAAQLFRLLALGRIEIALYEHWMGVALAKQQGLREARPLQPALATREMFVYLHKRHAPLVPRVAEALRALKREGFYERAYREKLLPYREAAAP
jgi:polar amino acid transport system substrate-binding protein